MIANEEEEIVEVKSETYKRIISNYGGISIVIVVNLIMTCFMISAVYGNNVLLEWAN
jgi:hypothetical protein